MQPKANVIKIELHHGSRKSVATLRTVRTLINNLIIGVTKGFKYKMRYVYAQYVYLRVPPQYALVRVLRQAQ
jgi:large subunit ribosomal protein L9e